MTVQDDPRDASAETKMTLPESWTTDAPGTFSLFLSGLIMVTRNRWLAWPNLALSLNSLFNNHPLRTKGDSGGGATSRMIAASALVACYLPLFMIQPGRTPTQTPLPVPGQ
ncbi:hypothetical protein BDY19DRAFT_895679 [Irpex rosettiformis]|uniref:Uncharacterized protein n=1 Tax=Irpex rosettiformis TaxID=378272 RepID=A0ACB8TV64_9APHY|nr:hypothetical protein BDY19DRAFT_895679 [Irpex rosettiformis]